MFAILLLAAVAYTARQITHVDREWRSVSSPIIGMGSVIGAIVLAGPVITLVVTVGGLLLGWATGREGWARWGLLTGGWLCVLSPLVLWVLAIPL